MYKKILLPIDHTEESSWRAALPAAVEQAQNQGAALHAVTVVPDVPSLPNLPADYGSGMIDFARDKLEAIIRDHVPADLTVTSRVRQGTIYREILAEAKDAGTDLVVMGSTRPDLSDYLLGPNAARVVRHAKSSVFVVRD